jgi:hypothetical protein
MSLLSCSCLPVTASKSRDPGPEFIRPDVQSILQRVTGTDTEKVFQPRLTHGVHPPHYKLLTDKQLKEVCCFSTIYTIYTSFDYFYTICRCNSKRRTF